MEAAIDTTPQAVVAPRNDCNGCAVDMEELSASQGISSFRPLLWSWR